MLEASLLFELDYQFALVFGGDGFNDEVVVASIGQGSGALPRAVLVAVFKLFHIFSEYFLALFACHHHLVCPHNVVIFIFGVTLCAVPPLVAARGPNLHLRV